MNIQFHDAIHIINMFWNHFFNVFSLLFLGFNNHHKFRFLLDFPFPPIGTFNGSTPSIFLPIISNDSWSISKNHTLASSTVAIFLLIIILSYRATIELWFFNLCEEKIDKACLVICHHAFFLISPSPRIPFGGSLSVSKIYF